jgi:hypothetical protein
VFVQNIELILRNLTLLSVTFDLFQTSVGGREAAYEAYGELEEDPQA